MATPITSPVNKEINEKKIQFESQMTKIHYVVIKTRCVAS